MSNHSYFTSSADNLPCLGIPGTTGNVGQFAMSILKGDNRCLKDLPYVLKCHNCQMKDSLQTQQPPPGHLLNSVYPSAPPAFSQTASGIGNSAQNTYGHPVGHSPFNPHNQGAMQLQPPPYDFGLASIPHSGNGYNGYDGSDQTGTPSHSSTYPQSVAAPDPQQQQQQQQHYQQPIMGPAFQPQGHGEPALLSPLPELNPSFSPPHQNANTGGYWENDSQYTAPHTGSQDTATTEGHQQPPASGALVNEYLGGVGNGLYEQSDTYNGSQRLYDPNSVGEYGRQQGHF